MPKNQTPYKLTARDQARRYFRAITTAADDIGICSDNCADTMARSIELAHAAWQHSSYDGGKDALIKAVNRKLDEIEVMIEKAAAQRHKESEARRKKKLALVSRMGKTVQP